MKKFLILITAAFGVIDSSYGITHVLNGPAGVVISANTTYADSFNLLAPTVVPLYNPSIEQITSATANFILSDPTPLGLGSETLTVYLDNTFFGSAQNFSIVGIVGSVNVSLINNNALQFSIVSGPGSVVPTILAFSQLQFETAERSISVPDGGTTMALLGIGLIGVGWMGRRLRA